MGWKWKYSHVNKGENKSFALQKHLPKHILRWPHLIIRYKQQHTASIT